MEVLCCILLAVAAFTGMVIYALYGATNALVLTWRFGEAVVRGEVHRPWSFVVGGGWFLLLGGFDLIADGEPAALHGGCVMVALSFAAWIAAGALYKREQPPAP